jgi:hypothetical protein
MDAQGLLCCDFGPETRSRYTTPPPYAYTDHLGFRYRLCAWHYAGFVTALERISRAGREGGRHPKARGQALRRILAGESLEDARVDGR